MDGFVGIPLDEGQMADDVILLLLLGLLMIFAIVFRTNILLFYKMLKDVWQVKERQNLFENISGNEFFYGNFMTFQALFLAAISLFSIGRIYQYIPYTELKVAALCFSIILVFLYVLYEFKKGVYSLIGFVFVDKERLKLWKTNYHAIIRTWGMTLYLPVFFLVFMDRHFLPAVILFVILYFLCRFVILYKSVGIFFNKKHGFFYIFMYLCGLEILPLVILYRVIIFLYNFIEASAIWH
ncbi:MAG: DUF4271 domain-containing protein [Tannerellaceae bacterium]|nr:DUF4271 domain-containing protein [Tannerellaceae bacterium]